MDMKWVAPNESAHTSFTAFSSEWLDPRACSEVVNQALRTRPAEERLGLLILEVRGLSEHLGALMSEGDGGALVSLATQLPTMTAIARIGRETLALVFPGLKSVSEAEALAQAATSAPLLICDSLGAPIPLDVRAGLAVAPDHGGSYETLLARAELAIAELRRQKAATFVTFHSDIQVEALRRCRLRQDLEGADQRGEFELFYQPQIDLATGRMVGAEALLRWNHPTHGLLLPNEFLAGMEKTAQARRVDSWVLETAALQAVEWNGTKPGIRVAINIFPDRLGPELVCDVERMLDVHGLAPENLEIEIPERHALDDLRRAAATVRSLRRLGVSVALDDFGTGFASLNAISALEVNRLKIDRSFVSDMLSNGKSVAIVSTLIELGRRIDLSILAEGIETPEQRDVLQAFGCNEGQGYLFGKAVRPEQLRSGHPADALAR